MAIVVYRWRRTVAIFRTEGAKRRAEDPETGTAMESGIGKEGSELAILP